MRQQIRMNPSNPHNPPLWGLEKREYLLLSPFLRPAEKSTNSFSKHLPCVVAPLHNTMKRWCNIRIDHCLAFFNTKSGPLKIYSTSATQVHSQSGPCQDHMRSTLPDPSAAKREKGMQGPMPSKGTYSSYNIRPRRVLELPRGPL